MSRVTVEQLCELFRQLAEGKISSEALQELLEKSAKLGFSYMSRQVLGLARKAAAEISGAYSRAKALAAIAGASHEALKN